MNYFKINGNDYSIYCNSLKVKRAATYRSQTNAAGNTVIDNAIPKRIVEVGIIPLSDLIMEELLGDVYGFKVELSYRNPATNELEEGIVCVIPESEIEYYTIRDDKVLYKAFNLTFTEL